MRRIKYLPVLVFVFGLLYLLFYVSTNKPIYGYTKCGWSGDAYKCEGYGNCRSDGTCAFSSPSCSSTPTESATCSGESAATCVRANKVGRGCVQTDGDSCKEQTVALDLTNKDCRWYETNPASGCRSSETSCSSGSQCCSGTCKAGKCAKTMCAGVGENPNEYALSCCTGLNVSNGKCQAVCAAPKAPTGLTLRGAPSGPICPRKYVIEWKNIPAGKESAFRADNPPTSWDLDDARWLCNKPNGKSHAGDECWEGPPTEWSYNFENAGRYRVWVHSYNRACGSFSNSVSAFFDVSEQPRTPKSLKVDGSSSNPITLAAGDHTVSWSPPSNGDDNTRYTLYVNDLANDFDSTCETKYPGDSCALKYNGTSYTRNFATGHTYNIRVYSNSYCSAYGKSDGYISTQIIVNASACTNSKPTGLSIPSVAENDANGSVRNVIQTRDVKITWTPPSSWGRACSNASNYQILRIFKNGAKIYETKPLSAGSNNLDTETFSSSNLMLGNKRPIIGNGQKFTAQICAYNSSSPGSNNYLCTSLDFYKDAYDTGKVSGPFKTYDSQSKNCTADSIDEQPLPFMSLSAENKTGVTSGCGTISATGFECTTTIDNDNRDPLSPDPEAKQDYNLTVSLGQSSKYSRIYYDNDITSCTGATQYTIPVKINLNLDKNTNDWSSPVDSKNMGLYFETLPQFYKVKNTSFMSRSGISMKFPSTINSFQDDDSDDTEEPFFNIGDSTTDYKGVGTVISSSGIDYGPNGATSKKMWQKSGYGTINTMSFNELASYIKKKPYTEIESLNELTDNGIYLISPVNGINISSNDTAFFNGKNMILLVDGNVTIGDDFTPNKSVAIIASEINISPDVENLQGLFAADKITLGGDLIPLKSVGNITSLSDSGVTGHRVRDDTSRPSELFVFDPSLYINLLPYLSVSPYEWRQLQ